MTIESGRCLRLSLIERILSAKRLSRMQKEKMPKQQRKHLGRYIVADPKICHGKPTFIGTHIMVWQVLQQLAIGRSWNAIVAAWSRNVSKEPIAEARAVAESIRTKTSQVIDKHWKGPVT